MSAKEKVEVSDVDMSNEPMVDPEMRAQVPQVQGVGFVSPRSALRQQVANDLPTASYLRNQAEALVEALPSIEASDKAQAAAENLRDAAQATMQWVIRFLAELER